MGAPSPPLSVQVADPSYGPGLDPTESETAEVVTDVERRDWAPLDPEPAPAGELVFVDGVQQVEAWLTASVAGEPEPIAGFAAAIGAGAVVAGPGIPARIDEMVVRRVVLTTGDRRLILPPVGGFAWEAQAASAHEATGMARRVGQLRQQVEHSLAERLARPGRLVVLDGRLSFIRDQPGAIVGAIKSHHRMYLPPAQAAVVTALRVGQRTPLFAIGTDRLSWYQRLPNVGEAGWAGILRGELPRALGVAEARRLADRAAAELPRFAGRPHRDPRAPQNLAPIAALEERLRHRLGDRRLALRAVRRAAAAATLEAGGLPAIGPVRVAVAEADSMAA
ncbi:MAG: hypothetical protein QOD86_878 [Miltoncostaeaceae bacterium]|jgi:hypothetical protein|nr:hypothetical protein [Miltoncostaeaceae bacterium]